MKHKIKKVEPILITAPYASQGNMEVLLHLPHGYRTCGMVKITLENGLYGVGEGYLAVFAPLVFREIVSLTIPYIQGRYIEDYKQIVNDLEVVTGYWSRQGAARHVISAVDIALHDLLSQMEGLPLYKYLNPDASGKLELYASGGDSRDSDGMAEEIEQVSALGIKTFKIRARKEQTTKANWCISQAAKRGIGIAIDMTQNLVVPGQTVDDVLSFIDSLEDVPVFIEEPLGPEKMDGYPILRKQAGCKIAGGEIITHTSEMINYIRNGYYDIAQPDATVIGGISSLKKIFDMSEQTDIYVHCWGGAAGMNANYHAAAAYGGPLVEWPLPYFPIREDLNIESYKIIKGVLYLHDIPGLGISLTDSIIKNFPFKPEAIYNCLPSNKNITINY